MKSPLNNEIASISNIIAPFEHFGKGKIKIGFQQKNKQRGTSTKDMSGHPRENERDGTGDARVPRPA
jgi:hypothetical protein